TCALPILLDLFCCEGGAAKGYRDAGFDVYGVDMDPKFRKRYPYAFLTAIGDQPVDREHPADALVVLAHLIAGGSLTFTHKDGRTETLYLSDFNAIHASPPCQAYSIATTGTPGARANHPRLIEPVRAQLKATGLPYVIENVV